MHVEALNTQKYIHNSMFLYAVQKFIKNPCPNTKLSLFKINFTYFFYRKNFFIKYIQIYICKLIHTLFPYVKLLFIVLFNFI